MEQDQSTKDWSFFVIIKRVCDSLDNKTFWGQLGNKRHLKRIPYKKEVVLIIKKI